MLFNRRSNFFGIIDTTICRTGLLTFLVEFCFQICHEFLGITSSFLSLFTFGFIFTFCVFCGHFFLKFDTFSRQFFFLFNIFTVVSMIVTFLVMAFLFEAVFLALRMAAFLGVFVARSVVLFVSVGRLVAFVVVVVMAFIVVLLFAVMAFFMAPFVVRFFVVSSLNNINNILIFS